MNLNEIVWTELELAPAETLKGTDAEDWPDVEIKLGQPIALDAVKYLRSAGSSDPAIDLMKAKNDFYYVRTPVSVRPSERWHIGLLNVEFQLVNESGMAEAWSMMPERIEAEQKILTSGTLSPKLKFDLGTDVSAELSPGELKTGREYLVYQPLVYAFNVGSRTPAWEFTPAPGREIRGIQLLHMIVRQPKRSNTQGYIETHVELRRTGGIIWRLFGRPKARIDKRLLFDIPSLLVP